MKTTANCALLTNLGKMNEMYLKWVENSDNGYYEK